MKKLSKLTETYWSGMNKRAQGTSVRKEDKKSFVTVDGVKYDIGELLLTVPEFEEKEGEEWFGLGFDKPKDGSTVISQNEDFEFSTEYDDMSSNYDVYVLHKYIDMTREEHIKEMIDKGDIDKMGNPPIQKILEKYLNKIYDDNYMSEYAEYVINSLTMTDFSVNLCFDVSTHDCYPDDVEYDNNDILDSNTIMYPVIDNWYIELLKELREEYEKLGWTESMNHIIDPYDSPKNTDEICFLKLKDGAKTIENDDEEEEF